MAKQEYTPTEARMRERLEGSYYEPDELDRAFDKIRAEGRAKRPDREQMAFALFLHESGQDEAFLRRIWEGHPAEHPVKLNYYGLADAAISSLALEPEARETEVVEFNDGPAFRSRGIVHTLTVAPTPGGWLVTCEDLRGEASCNLPPSDAVKLAQMLHPEAREVTDSSHEAEVLAVEEAIEESVRMLLITPGVTLDGLSKHLPGILTSIAGKATRAALAATAREVSRDAR